MKAIPKQAESLFEAKFPKSFPPRMKALLVNRAATEMPLTETRFAKYSVPEIAKEWVLTLSDDRIRARALKLIFRQWDLYNSSKAKIWARSLEEEDQKLFFRNEGTR